MKFNYGLTAALIGSVIIAVRFLTTKPLEDNAINEIAKQITVRIDGQINEFDGKMSGSGVIVKQQGNIYTVLTNWHVVQIKGKYTLRTSDSQTHTINSSQTKRLGILDLATVQFSSNRNYPQAKLGNSSQLTETSRVYAAGWAANDEICLDRCYRFIDGNITSVLSRYKDGYGLIYSNNIVPGMSGGPVFNQDGQLVAINGRASTSEGGITSFGAIPINEYKVAVDMGSLLVSTSPSRTTTINNTPPPLRVDYSKFDLVRTLSGYSGDVNSVAISADGQTLVSGSGDKTIKIWRQSGR